jgi:hypothetical protein
MNQPRQPKDRGKIAPFSFEAVTYLERAERSLQIQSGDVAGDDDTANATSGSGMAD